MVCDLVSSVSATNQEQLEVKNSMENFYCEICGLEFNYLRSLRDLHSMCMAKHLPDNFRDVIDDFRRKFFYLHQNFNLSMTLKIHVILDHYSYYFEQTGSSFKDTSSEYLRELPQQSPQT